MSIARDSGQMDRGKKAAAGSSSAGPSDEGPAKLFKNNKKNWAAYKYFHTNRGAGDGILAEMFKEFGADKEDTDDVELPEELLNGIKRMAFSVIPELHTAYEYWVQYAEADEAGEADESDEADEADEADKEIDTPSRSTSTPATGGAEGNRPRVPPKPSKNRFWPALEKLTVEKLTLPSVHAKLFQLSPEDFFEDTDILVLQRNSTLAGQFVSFYKFQTQVGERAKQDRIRSVVVSLYWHELFSGLRATVPQDDVNKEYAPQLNKSTTALLYDNIITNGGGSEIRGAPDIATFHAFLTEQSKLGDRYAYLAKAFGYGGLIHLLPHFNDANISKYLAKKSDSCASGREYLVKLGLRTWPEVVRLNGVVEDLLTFLREKVFAGLQEHVTHEATVEYAKEMKRNRRKSRSLQKRVQALSMAGDEDE